MTGGDIAATKTHKARQVTTSEDQAKTKPTRTLRPKGGSKNGTVPIVHEAQQSLRNDQHISNKRSESKTTTHD